MKILFTGDCRIDGQFSNSVISLPELFDKPDAMVINAEFAIASPGAQLANKSTHILAERDDVSALISNASCPLVFNVANNHAEDAGGDALENWASLAARQGAAVVGMSNEHIIQDNDGIKVGILSYTTGSRLNKISVFNESTSANEIRAVKSTANAVIVLMHWGEEYIFSPSPEQKHIARICAEAGADLIIGCHPHVLQGTEIINDTTVYYSLGNTAFRLDNNAPGTSAGGVVEAEFSSQGVSSTLHISKLDDEHHIALLGENPQKQIHELLDDETKYTYPLTWYRKACRPFFSNHLASWNVRIRKQGFIELMRMAKAFLSPYYLKMLTGFVCGGFMNCSQKSRAEQIEQLVCLKN